jgi:hypothetical protein
LSIATGTTNPAALRLTFGSITNIRQTDRAISRGPGGLDLALNMISIQPRIPALTSPRVHFSKLTYLLGLNNPPSRVKGSGHKTRKALRAISRVGRPNYLSEDGAGSSGKAHATNGIN